MIHLRCVGRYGCLLQKLIFTALAVSGCGDIQVIGNLHLIFVVVSLHKKGWFEFQVKKMICLDFS